MLYKEQTGNKTVEKLAKSCGKPAWHGAASRA
jgi:hypothetical protein